MSVAVNSFVTHSAADFLQNILLVATVYVSVLTDLCVLPVCLCVS